MAKRKTVQVPKNDKEREIEAFLGNDYFDAFDLSQMEETTVQSSAEFWDFSTTPEFVGRFTGVTLNCKEDDPEHNRKKGDLMAFEFMDTSGQLWWIGASHQMRTLLSNESYGAGSVFKIIFKGKKPMKNGRSVNLFEIRELRPKK